MIFDIKLQSKLNYTTINHSWSHEQYIHYSDEMCLLNCCFLSEISVVYVVRLIHTIANEDRQTGMLQWILGRFYFHCPWFQVLLFCRPLPWHIVWPSSGAMRSSNLIGYIKWSGLVPFPTKECSNGNHGNCGVKRGRCQVLSLLLGLVQFCGWFVVL